MGRIRCLIADDEKPARLRLEELIQRQPGLELAGTAADGRQAVELLRRSQPDLLFLDVQMPELDGFGVLAEVGPEAMPVTIFVTAYDRYAIRAFEAHAIDYLLKPFSDERFEAALERARRWIEAQRASELTQRLVELAAAAEAGGHQAGKRGIDRIVLKSGGRVTFLNTGEIDWIEAAGVYVYLHAGGKTHLYRSTIGQLCAKLDPRRFVRVHRSAAVNTERIRELHPRSHGDYTILLQDGTELTLSRKYRAALESWLGQPL